MSEPVWIECPHCDSRLKLKNRNIVGKKVPCPKCKEPFRIEVPPESEAELEAFEDDFESFDHDDADEYSNEAVPVADGGYDDYEDDEYEDDDGYAAPSRSPRGKQPEQKSNGMVIGLAIGGGSLLVVGAVVGMYFAFSGGDAGQRNAAVATSAAAPPSQPAEAATDSPGDETDGADAAANGADAPAANGNGAAAPGAGNSAPALGGLGGGNRNLTDAQRQAIAERIRNNKDAKAGMKKAIEERKDDLQRETKWTAEMLEEFAADQRLPPDQRKFHPDGKRKRPGDAAPAKPQPAQQPVAQAATPQPATQPASTPVVTAAATQDAAPDPEKAAETAIRELGGRVNLNGDRRVDSVQLRNLEELSDDDLEHLQVFESLEKLDLGFSPIGDEGLAHLAELTQLKGLNLAGTNITNDGLEHLTGLKNLEHLSVQQTEISNRGIRHLTQLESLQNFFWGRSKIKQIGLKQLAKALPNCNIEQ